MSYIELSFESDVGVSPQKAWEWITSLDGISKEMWPYFRMTAPEGIESINSLNVTLGKAIFCSRVFLFGFIPFDHSDLTLIELNEGEGFVEQSPMRSMKLWRHERRIIPNSNGCIIKDHLTFEPRWAPSVVGWFIGTVFQHRHKVIRRALYAAA